PRGRPRGHRRGGCASSQSSLRQARTRRDLEAEARPPARRGTDMQLTADRERALAHVPQTVAFGRARVVEADAVVRYLQDDAGIVQVEPHGCALGPCVPSDVTERVSG